MYIFFAVPVFIMLLMYGFSCIPFAYFFGYLRTLESGYAKFLLINMFGAPVLAITVIVMELSRNDYYEEMSQIISSLASFYPQFALTYMASKYSQVMVNNYNWDIKSETDKKHMCKYDWNPCCSK